MIVTSGTGTIRAERAEQARIGSAQSAAALTEPKHVRTITIRADQAEQKRFKPSAVGLFALTIEHPIGTALHVNPPRGKL
jgi:hypothetical protein